jgi:hypothetical protein
MTIDERLEFLVKSTESLHASISELHATVQEHERRWAQLMRSLRAALEAWIADNGNQPEA